MSRFNFLWFIMILFLSSCTGEDENNPSHRTPAPNYRNLDIDFVTGINLTDVYGNLQGTLGNPNVSYDMFTYPNPFRFQIHIKVYGQIEKAWVIRATLVTGSLPANFASKSIDLDLLAKKSLMEISVGSSDFRIDFTGIEKGYYRIFCLLTDGTVRVGNVYYDPEGEFLF